MSSSVATAGLIQTLAGERALFWGLLASIALHALVLLGLPQRDAQAPPAKAPLVLTARLAPVTAAPSATPSPPRPPPPPARPAPAPPPLLSKPALTPTPPALAPSPPVPTRQKAAPAEALETESPEAAAAVPAAPASSARPAGTSQPRPAPQAPVGATTGATARSGDEADKGTLERYRLALIMATRRYKRYPAKAMENGWQGRVVVRMVIGANGMLVSTSVKTSSGYEILDNQALDMLKKGKTTVPIPASLRGREFAIDVPVIFNLESADS